MRYTIVLIAIGVACVLSNNLVKGDGLEGENDLRDDTGHSNDDFETPGPNRPNKEKFLHNLDQFASDYPQHAALVDRVKSGELDAKEEFEKQSLSIKFIKFRGDRPKSEDEVNTILNFIDDYVMHITGARNADKEPYMKLTELLEMVNKTDKMVNSILELGDRLKGAQCGFDCLGQQMGLIMNEIIGGIMGSNFGKNMATNNDDGDDDDFDGFFDDADQDSYQPLKGPSNSTDINSEDHIENVSPSPNHETSPDEQGPSSIKNDDTGETSNSKNNSIRDTEL